MENESLKHEAPNIVIELNNEKYIIPSEQIQKMISVEKVQKTVNPNAFHLGVLVHGEEIFQCIDLRVFMGLKSLDVENRELAEMLSERERDHVNWVKELKASVIENREFKLQRDPMLCAFGRWYYSFRTSNVVLAQQLSLFDSPHKQIHQLAVQVLEESAQNHDRALELIERAEKGIFTNLIRLFESVRRLLLSENQKVGIIIQGQRQYCIVVDSITAVRKINVDKEEKYSSNPYILGTIKEHKTDEVLQRFNLDLLLKNLDEYYRLTNDDAIKKELTNSSSMDQANSSSSAPSSAA